MTEITQADRATAHTWWMHREHDERDLPAYFARHREQAAAEERAAIVAWLRKVANINPQEPAAKAFVLLLCKAIEGGEYIK